MITVTTSGSWGETERYLNRIKNADFLSTLDQYGAQGAAALAAVTPSNSGLAANSWYYTVERKSGYTSIQWHNSDVEDGFPVAIMIQYGHGTGTGGYVTGRDYINPVIRPLFDKILAELMREVKSA